MPPDEIYHPGPSVYIPPEYEVGPDYGAPYVRGLPEQPVAQPHVFIQPITKPTLPPPSLPAVSWEDKMIQEVDLARSRIGQPGSTLLRVERISPTQTIEYFEREPLPAPLPAVESVAFQVGDQVRIIGSPLPSGIDQPGDDIGQIGTITDIGLSRDGRYGYAVLMNIGSATYLSYHLRKVS